ncbi:hypothetical protein CPAR01_04132, partial [Colletotrichum paranaense]
PFSIFSFSLFSSSNNAPSCLTTNPFIHFSWTLEQCSTNYQFHNSFLHRRLFRGSSKQPTNGFIPSCRHTESSVHTKDCSELPSTTLNPTRLPTL